MKGAIAGGIAGAMEVILTYPINLIRNRMQLDQEHKKYDGTWDCMRKTIRRHGFFGLYRGASIILLNSIATVASRFGAYEFYCYKLIDDNGRLSMLTLFLSGLLAGVTEAVVVLTPLQTIRLKLINDMHLRRPRYHGFIHGLLSILKREGIRGIYRGVTITAVKQGTNQAIRFFLVITQKDFYRDSDQNTLVPLHLLGIFGVISGAANVLGSTPYKLIMKRVKASKSRKTKREIMYGASKNVEDSGPGQFFMNSSIEMIRAGVDVAVTFMVYEGLMDYVFNNMWN
ncbi:hypothetical protein KR044_012043 [Drosophila immigrans]|nr:hypothetical protein KR044_012043 [Drosophila immigrans]